MGAAITHAAAVEIDDGNIFGCADDAETELLKGGACRSRWNASFFSAIDVKSGLLKSGTSTSLCHQNSPLRYAHLANL